MDALLDLDRIAGQVAAAVLFLIPGLNTTWMIDRLAGRTTPPGAERLLKAISWSVIIYLAASPWLIPRLRDLGATPVGRYEALIAGGLLLVLAPLALGGLTTGLRRWQRLQRWLQDRTGIHPAPTAWDFAFASARSGFVLVRLTDGRLLGGAFASGSFASAYPEPQDLFIERAWRIDEEGTFLEPLDGNEGLLVRRDAIQSVQFFEKETDGG